MKKEKKERLSQEKFLRARRDYKDTLFRMIFDDRENLLNLFNAVNQRISKIGKRALSVFFCSLKNSHTTFCGFLQWREGRAGAPDIKAVRFI